MNNQFSDHKFQTALAAIGGGLGGAFGVISYVHDAGLPTAQCIKAGTWGVGYSFIGSFVGYYVGQVLDGMSIIGSTHEPAYDY